MSKEAAKCTVCYDPFTKQPHKKQAACPYCDIQACTTCTQTYLINSFEDPHCMGCRKAWSREVLDSILLTTWINGDYKKHRENILLDREKSRLPAAQLMVGLRKRAKELQPVKAQILTEIKEMEKRIAELRDTYLTVERRIQSLMRGQVPEEQTAEKKEEKEHRVFIMPCPAADCRGFLSTAYKCGVCDVYVCPDCREVKGTNRDAAHTCDENTKASVEKLKKETKPCPECGAGIFKIEGCDQMYCTACNTPFSWRTGMKVTNGVIHNPHYFEFLRKSNGGVMPRNPGDIPCITNLPGAWTFEREFMRKYDMTGNKECMALYQALNVITHIQHVEIPHNTNRAEDTDNTELNVRYLLQELDEKTWKQQLQQKEKKRIKKDDLRMRFEAFVGACVDIYGTLMNTTREVHSVKSIIKIYEDKKKKTVKLCQNAYKNLLAMRNIFNESMMDISKRYKCQVLQIDDDFRRSSKKFTTSAKRTKKAVKKADDSDSDSSDTEAESVAPKNTIVKTA
jgi:hypothetical protein